MKKAYFNWSSGKDSSLALYYSMKSNDLKVVSFIDNYPKNADICGENGEYHSFVFDGPIFKKPVEFHMKQKYHREYHQPETNQIHRYSYLELE